MICTEVYLYTQATSILSGSYIKQLLYKDVAHSEVAWITATSIKGTRMNKLLIVARQYDDYRKLLAQAQLPALEITEDPAQASIILADPPSHSRLP